MNEISLTQWALNNGLAVLIVVAGGFALWRSASWMAVNVITPGKDAFTLHLKAIGEFMGATTKSLESTAKSMDTICNEMRSIRQDVDAISKKIEGDN